MHMADLHQEFLKIQVRKDEDFLECIIFTLDAGIWMDTHTCYQSSFSQYICCHMTSLLAVLLPGTDAPPRRGPGCQSAVRT